MNNVTAIPYDSTYQSISIIHQNEIMIDEIVTRLTKLEHSTPDFTELKCRECGGAIEQKYEDHIVKCPYCKTVYAIGRKHING